METTEKPAFVDLMNRTASVLPKKFTDQFLRMYWDGLKDLPFESVKFAFSRSIVKDAFFPAIARVRELAGEGEALARRCELAWCAVRKTDWGHRGLLEYSDPLVTAAIRILGGREYFGSLSDHEFETWTRKSFLETYRRLVELPPDPGLTRPLGKLDHANELALIRCGLGPTPKQMVACEYHHGPQRVESENEDQKLVRRLSERIEIKDE